MIPRVTGPGRAQAEPRKEGQVGRADGDADVVGEVLDRDRLAELPGSVSDWSAALKGTTRSPAAPTR